MMLLSHCNNIPVNLNAIPTHILNGDLKLRHLAFQSARVTCRIGTSNCRATDHSGASLGESLESFLITRGLYSQSQITLATCDPLSDNSNSFYSHCVNS